MHSCCATAESWPVDLMGLHYHGVCLDGCLAQYIAPVVPLVRCGQLHSCTQCKRHANSTGIDEGVYGIHLPAWDVWREGEGAPPPPHPRWLRVHATHVQAWYATSTTNQKHMRMCHHRARLAQNASIRATGFRPFSAPNYLATTHMRICMHAQLLASSRLRLGLHAPDAP